jgi:Uma2 family endonuclease
MVAQQDRTRGPLSVDEWRELVRTSGIRYEYHDGWVCAMAGGSLAHGRIAFNAQQLLDAALGDGPCWVHTSAIAVRLSPSEYRFPDVTVSCDPGDRPTTARTEVSVPRVIIEVLSDSTEREDRTSKLAIYRACPSVETYLLVATDVQGVEVYQRAAPHWTYERYGPGEQIEIESIGIRLAVDALYRLTDVPLVRACRAAQDEGMRQRSAREEA